MLMTRTLPPPSPPSPQTINQLNLVLVIIASVFGSSSIRVTWKRPHCCYHKVHVISGSSCAVLICRKHTRQSSSRQGDICVYTSLDANRSERWQYVRTTYANIGTFGEDLDGQKQPAARFRSRKHPISTFVFYCVDMVSI